MQGRGRWNVIKALASLMLSLCFCLPGWAEKSIASVDSNEIKQEIRNAVRDLQIQIPELLKAVRIRVQVPEIQVQIPEIRVHLPEILIPEIRLQLPVHVQIPEIELPEIRIHIPKIDIQTRDLPE
jgi:hypothetical protein